MASSFSIYYNMINCWSSSSNLLGIDFELYSSYSDLVAGTNGWTFCDYDDCDGGVAFPRDCSPSSPEIFNWNSLVSTSYYYRAKSYKFEILLNCPTETYTSSASTRYLIMAYSVCELNLIFIRVVELLIALKEL